MKPIFLRNFEKFAEFIEHLLKGAATSFVEEEAKSLEKLLPILLMAPVGGIPVMSPLEALSLANFLLEERALSPEELMEGLKEVLEGTFTDPWMYLSDYADLS